MPYKPVKNVSGMNMVEMMVNTFMMAFIFDIEA